MTYLGKLATSCLNDTQIRPTEYRKWADAVGRFERRDQDRAIIAELTATIPQRGLDEPITLGISARYPQDVYVSDGHHRAVALMAIGAESFPFHWHWITWGHARLEHEPFPYRALGLHEATAHAR